MNKTSLSIIIGAKLLNKITFTFTNIRNINVLLRLNRKNKRHGCQLPYVKDQLSKLRCHKLSLWLWQLLIVSDHSKAVNCQNCSSIVNSQLWQVSIVSENSKAVVCGWR